MIDLCVMCSPKPLTTTGRRPVRRARSSVVTTTPAPPEQGITISSRCSGSTTMGEFSTSSMVIGWSRKIAFGFWSAFSRPCTAIFASVRGSRSYSYR